MSSAVTGVAPSQPRFILYLFISHTSTFQFLDKPWSQVSSVVTGVAFSQPRFSLSFFISHTSTFQLLGKQWSQVSPVVTGVVPSSPRFLPSICIAHRVQQSHCLSLFCRVLLTHALALFASQFVHEKKSPRIYTSMHFGGFETHETDPYQARGSPDTPPGRPAYLSRRGACSVF